MRLFMIFFALVLAVASGLAVWLLTGSDDGSVVGEVGGIQPVAVEETSIIIARRDIPVGHRITEEDLDQQTWPQSLVLPDFVIAGDQGQLIDRITRTPFKERQPLSLSYVANPNDPGFIAAQIPAGKRAVTIPIDDVSGVSGFIFPGDRVDVIIKHRVGLNRDYEAGDGNAGGINAFRALTDPNYVPPAPETAIPLPLARKYTQPTLMLSGKHGGQPVLNITEVLIPNARVLAVGTLISLQDQENRGAPSTVTLEVSEVEAQKIRHAEQGSLTLTLRSLDDANEARIPRPVGDSDLSRLIPPSYFPNIYDHAPYETTVIGSNSLETFDLPEDRGKPSGESFSKPNVNVIRGTRKETLESSLLGVILQAASQNSNRSGASSNVAEDQ